MTEIHKLYEILHSKYKVKSALIDEVRQIAEQEHIQCEVNDEKVIYTGNEANAAKIDLICILLSPDQDENKP